MRLVGRSATGAALGVADHQQAWCEPIGAEEAGESDESGRD